MEQLHQGDILKYDEVFENQEKDICVMKCNDKYDSDYKYAPTDQNKTTILYDNNIKLFVVSKGEHLEFEKDVVSVGKMDDCDVKLDSNYISRQHARFYFENSTWFIADTDSMNGVWLNGNKLEPKTKI